MLLLVFPDLRSYPKIVILQLPVQYVCLFSSMNIIVSKITLNNRDDSGHPFFILDFNKNAFITFKHDVGFNFSVKEVTLYSEFKSGIGNDICQMYFHLASIEIIPWRIILV